MMVYLETGHKKYNYFTEEEVKTLSKDELLLQASLGLQTCKQVKDAIKIMEDVWQIAQEKKDGN
jgi:predicted RNA-binding protein associated with RNAse of E/G family